MYCFIFLFFFFQAEDGIRDTSVTGVQTCALPISIIKMKPATLSAVRRGDAPKGDVLGTARTAGILAAKRTSELIPLCHPLRLKIGRASCRERAESSGGDVAAKKKRMGRES